MHFRAWLALTCLGVICFATAAENSRIMAAVRSSSRAEIPASQPAAPAITGEKLSDVLQIIRGFTNGMAQVIVTLAPPTALRRTDFGSKASLSTLRGGIKKLRQTVLDNLPASEVRPGFQFDNIAGFSAEVTLNGLKALQAHPSVISIEPVFVLSTHLAQGISLMHGLTYRSSYNGAGIAIAICDTGIDYNHPRLGGGGFPNSKVLGGFDFGDNDPDPIPNGNGHGTACAGIAAGDVGTVGDYIGGVAYNARLYALKISPGATASASSSAMVAAWDWCVTHKNDNPSYPIMVISTSFGGGQFFSTCNGATPAMTAAANNAADAGITVIVSSGNDGFCDSIAWPACISSVISVGAVYDAAFGNFSTCVSAASCSPKFATTNCATGYYTDDLTAPDKVPSYAKIIRIVSSRAICRRKLW